MEKDSLNENIPAILAGEGLPNFKEITAEQINRYIPSLINTLEKEFTELEYKLNTIINENDIITWEDVMLPLEKISEKIRWSWGTASHLNGVANDPDFRDAYSAQQSKVVSLTNRISQSKPIHRSLSILKQNNYKDLNITQRRIIDSELLSMNNRGVALEGDKKEKFNRNAQELAEMATIFSNNVLDSTKEFSILIRDSLELEGIPERVLELYSNFAEEAGDLQENGCKPTKDKGPWRIGLDMPRYIPIMTYCHNRKLRELVYKEYVSRASKGKYDNTNLIEKLLETRKEQALALGYKNWAELSLSSKMANDVSEVEKLLDELRQAALPIAKKELNDIREYSNRHQSIEDGKLEPWDLAYWSERLKKERFNLDNERLRAWFPLSQVLNGLFCLCERLFEISIKQADGEAPVWNEDVKFFKVFDDKGNQLAAFYLDPFSRPENKRGGAWMDECLIKRKKEDGKDVLPVAYLICNQTRPTKDCPSLMSFEEVQTLFHEFGHGLQHLLTKVEYPQAAGINNIEWDAVELPSQFMENWCLDKSTILGLAKHWKTSEVLPEDEFNKLISARNFNSGLATLRQVHFALTDIRLHNYWTKEYKLSPDEVRREIALTTSVMQPIEEDKFLCGFSHIFAGGYSAGYYSYKWAEVLSADAYSAFEELQSEESIKTKGILFKNTILGLGGSRSPGEVFKAFMGREPNTNALIRHSGLIDA